MSTIHHKPGASIPATNGHTTIVMGEPEAIEERTATVSITKTNPPGLSVTVNGKPVIFRKHVTTYGDLAELFEHLPVPKARG